MKNIQGEQNTTHYSVLSDIQDEKWADVQKWLQQRLDTARRGKGIEQQPTLFDEDSFCPSWE